MMINEVLGRTATLDSKAQNMIGWTPALLVLFLATSPSDWPAAFATWQVVFLTIGSLNGVVALAAGALALRLVDVHWPSQQDWFRVNLFGEPANLRRYQLLALLGTHEAHSVTNQRKARFALVSQWALVIAGACVAMVLVVPAVARWLR